MKLLNRKNEARSSKKNINEGSFVVKQRYLLGYLCDWWKDFQEKLVLEQKIFNDSYILFSVLQNRTNSPRVENETILSHKCLVFNQSLWLLSSLKAALFARRESRIVLGFSANYTLAEGSKYFKNHSNCGHPIVLRWKFSIFIRRSPARVCGIDKNYQRHILHMFSFLLTNSMQYLFLNLSFVKNLHSLLSVSEFFLMLCKFSVFDGRYLFTIVHCHRASSASRVCAVFVNNKRSPHFSHVS